MTNLKKKIKEKITPSKGIKILSVVLIIIGAVFSFSILISFFQLCLLIELKNRLPFLFSKFPSELIASTIFWFSTFLDFLIKLSWIVSGVGMLFLKEWARQLLLISMGIYIINSMINIFLNVSLTYEYSEKIPVFWLSIGIAFILIFSIVVVYFFSHPSVISQFKRKSYHR